MPVGVSSQWDRIWNMEWNDATAQTGVPMPNIRQMLVALWGKPEVQQLVHCITQTV